MEFGVQTGTVLGAQKVVLYGPEGIGKTSMAAKFPDPIFIDTEDSTKQYPVKRLTTRDGTSRPDTWETLLDMVKAIRDGKVSGIKTLVVDSMDWAETLCIQSVCRKNNKSSIEDFGYGKGYTYVEEEFNKFLNLLSEVAKANVNVVCTAHAQLKKVELPEETGSYDHWEMKLEKRESALVKEWADMVLFMNYKTLVIKGANPMEKNKAAGGKRMMYTTHTPWWDAKNRHGLPEELPLDYESIAYLFNVQNTATAPEPVTVTPPEPKLDEDDSPIFDSGNSTKLPKCIPERVAERMNNVGMTAEDLEKVVYAAKCYPEGTKVQDFDIGFYGFLMSNWDNVMKTFKELKGENTNV